jgi:hypothetical protein
MEDIALIIERNVSNFYGVIDIRTKSRKQKYVKARQIISYFLRKYTSYSFTDIGDFFNQGHSNIVLGHQTITADIKNYKRLAKEVKYLEKKIKTDIDDENINKDTFRPTTHLRINEDVLEQKWVSYKKEEWRKIEKVQNQ